MTIHSLRTIRTIRRAAAAVFALALGASLVPTNAQNLIKDGPKVPDFSAKDLNGKPVSLASYKGKLLLIDFWATWCPPCRAEMPNVVKTYNRYNKQGFEILGVSLDRDKKALTSYLKPNGVTWRQVYDGDTGHAISQKYEIKAIPTMLLVDGTTGKLLAVNPRGPELEKAVAAALKARRK